MKKTKESKRRSTSFIKILKEYFDAKILGSQKGYLLIELLVAMTLFSVIVVIAIGSFVSVLKTQRQVAALSAAESNLNVAFEEMAREIRTGYSFSSTNGSLSFTSAEGKSITYSLDGNILEKNGLAITGNNVTVEYFNVVLFGNVAGDHWNPRVTVSVGIHSNEASLRGNVLNLQTTVSARQLDCDPANPTGC